MGEEDIKYATPEMIEAAIRNIHTKYYKLEKRIGDLLAVYLQGNFLNIFDYTPSSIDFEGKIPVWIWEKYNSNYPCLTKHIPSGLQAG